MGAVYDTEMHLVGRNTGIPVPPEVLEQLGAGKRPAVAVLVNGYAFTSTVGAMGGRALIPFSAAHRQASGIGGGDPLHVELAVDDAPRETVLPQDLADALEQAGARPAFDALAPSRRKAHVTGVEGAKAPETRARRIAAVVEACSA